MAPDRLFSVPRLAAVYDALDPDRRDLDVYLALLSELGARSVVDVGCGTGSFALLLARRGFEVTGIDPAWASLDVARAKPGAEAVRWILADAGSVTAGPVDAVTMTGNVAQVFTTDDAWTDAISRSFELLRPGGHLVFETRNPAVQAWLGWTRDATYREADVDAVGVVACWEQVEVVDLPLVSFRTTFEFRQNALRLTSTSTLRFRERAEIVSQLTAAGFEVREIRDAPDRPGLELVFIARRPDA